MMEVIATIKFTHMNTSLERRPFRVLRPANRSTAMVIARYSNRQPPLDSLSAQARQPYLLWRAVRLGSACAACAFAFFFLSQRNLFERTGETLGSLPDSIQRVNFAPRAPSPAVAAQLEDAKSIGSSAAPPAFAIPDEENLNVTQFNLSVTPEFQNVGDVKLRLSGVNAAANTYDITIKTNQREFYRQDVKLNEHIQLAKNTATGPELVVGAIRQNRVFGYLSEPLRRGHRRHRRRQ